MRKENGGCTASGIAWRQTFFLKGAASGDSRDPAGHSTTESTRYYLRVDFKQLKQSVRWTCPAYLPHFIKTYVYVMKTKTIKNGAYTSLIRLYTRLTNTARGYKMKSEELTLEKFNLADGRSKGRSQWYRQGNYLKGGSSHYQMRGNKNRYYRIAVIRQFSSWLQNQWIRFLYPQITPKQGLHSLSAYLYQRRAYSPVPGKVISCSRRTTLWMGSYAPYHGAVEDTIWDRAAIRGSPSAQKSRCVPG